MGTQNYSEELLVRYVQQLSPPEAQKIADAAQAWLTANSQSVSPEAYSIFRTRSTNYTPSGSVQQVITLFDSMTHPEDTAVVQRLEAVATRMGLFFEEESSSSSQSSSSQSSSSTSISTSSRSSSSMSSASSTSISTSSSSQSSWSSSSFSSSSSISTSSSSQSA